MANTILVKRSAVPGKVPTTSDIALGEIAINTFDGVMYIHQNNGADSIVQIGSNSTTFTGDVTGSGSGSIALTLATVNSNVGNFGSANSVATFTVNAKGLVTAASSTTIAIDASQITSGVLTTTYGGVGTSSAAGALLIGDGSGSWTSNTLTAGTGIDITDGSGTITIAADNSTILMDNAAITSITYTSSTTSSQVVDTISDTTVRTVKYFVQLTSGSDYQASEVYIIQDGTTPYITEYGIINTGATLATFDASITGSSLYLLFTPVNAITTVNAVRTTIYA